MEEADSAADPEIPFEDSWAVIGRLAPILPFPLHSPAGASMLKDNALHSTQLQKVLLSKIISAS